MVFETARGRVLRCACCGALEVRFGNALLALHATEFAEVLASVAAYDAPGDDDQGVPPDRPCVLYLGNSGCGWTFTPDEAAELHRLLAGSRLLLAARV